MNSITENIPEMQKNYNDLMSSEEMHSLTFLELREQIQSLPDGVVLTICFERGGTDHGKP